MLMQILDSYAQKKESFFLTKCSSWDWTRRDSFLKWPGHDKIVNILEISSLTFIIFGHLIDVFQQDHSQLNSQQSESRSYKQ